MNRGFHLAFAFCCFVVLGVCRADDVVVQMFSKKILNEISDKYISYSVDPNDLLKMYKTDKENLLYKLIETGPSYLKIFGNTTNQMRLTNDAIEMGSSKFSLDEFKAVYEFLRSTGIRPVIALPYQPDNWNTKNVIRMLGKFSELEINDVIWQLGADFRAKDAITYIDDLNTLRLMVDAFASNQTNKMNWRVVGSDITVGSSETEARLYSELSKYIVEAIGWSQSIELHYADDNVDDFFSNANIDPALRTILNSKIPIWLSLLKQNADQSTPLAQMKQGLNWAQTLGDAAKNGFKVVYSPINTKHTNRWNEPSLSYYTTLLHKRAIGQTVFDTKVFNGNFDAKFYAHCTRNMSGSFTMFGVNAGDSKLDVTARLPFKSGTEYLEFILTVSPNGKVLLNGHEIIEPSILAPIARSKLPGKATLLSMPAHSVGFWVFTRASIPECASTEPVSFEVNTANRMKTSAEHLLQELILETITRNKADNTANESNENAIRRTKRHAIIKKEFNNEILKEVENNGIAIDDDFSEQPRSKRFILTKQPRGGKLANLIYSDIDDIKRRNIMVPYKPKLNLSVSKRSKRNVLERLMEKFDAKKPTLTLKKPTLRLGSSLIPPIRTVHDIFQPNPVEKQIFTSVENPNLPSGDIHLEIGEELPAVPTPIENANNINNNNNVLLNPYAETMVPKTSPIQPINAYAYSNGGFAAPAEVPPLPMQPMNAINVPSTPVCGELSELEAQSAVTLPPQAPAINARTEKNLFQHNIDFVVKDLQPTWQVNRDNMEKARNNLQQFYWPGLNTPAANSKISSILPNVGHFQHPHPHPQQHKQHINANGEHVLFESRRRRRSISPKMNEEIERRVQLNSNNNQMNGDPADKIDILDKLLEIVESIERNNGVGTQANVRQLEQLLKETPLETNEPKGVDSDSSAQKKCKILSKAIEQQCMESENEMPKPIFPRVKVLNEIKGKKPTGPLKKLVAKVKSDVNKLNLRSKRSAHTDDNDDSAANTIQKIFNHENSLELWNTKRVPLQRLLETNAHETKSEEDDDPMAEERKAIPKFLQYMTSSVDKVMTSVTRQITQWCRNWW